MLNLFDQQRADKLSHLQAKLATNFFDIQKLNNALIHSSYINENKMTDYLSNERLEFLGDAVLKLVVSQYLFETYNEDEGRLTKVRSAVISDKVLAEIAREMMLSEYLLMGDNEQRNKGFERDRVLSDTLEAIIGALYLDSGLVAAKDLILKLLVTKISAVFNNEVISDPKSLLQEICQKNNYELPVYEVIEEIGPDHDKKFKVKVNVNKNGVFYSEYGVDSTKKKAEQDAARKILDKLLK